MNWQPIDTAPKDGTEILAAVRYPVTGCYETFFLYWVTEIKDYPEGVWAYDFDTPLTYGTPAYWMEVPRYVEPETKPCPHNPFA